MKNGIILSNYDDNQKAFDGVKFYRGQFPGIQLFINPASQEELDSAIKASQHKSVLIGLSGEDPVDFIFDLAALIEDPALLQLFFKQLRISGMHRQLRRICHSCAQAISVPEKVVLKLPTCLRPAGELTTCKCSGCESCDRSGFRGTVDISSVVDLNENLRKVLLKGGSAAQITELAYRAGTRSLLEDALAKNAGRETNLLEVFQNVKRISTPFLTAIANHKGAQTENPHEENVQSSLDASADQFFQSSSETPARNEELEVTPLPDLNLSRRQEPKRTILVVEDDLDQSDILALVFQAEGFEVITAANGRLALDALAKNKCDLVICDLMMPVMNGEQFVEEVRRNPLYNNLPILMFTAIDTQESELNLLSAGADDYCTKTSKREILIVRVKRLLARSSNPLAHYLKS